MLVRDLLQVTDATYRATWAQCEHARRVRVVTSALTIFGERVAEGYAPMQPAVVLWCDGSITVSPSPSLTRAEAAAWTDLGLYLTPCPMCPGPIAEENATRWRDLANGLDPDALATQLQSHEARLLFAETGGDATC